MSQPPGKRSPLILPALVFLLVIGVVEGVIFSYKGKLYSEQRLQALTFAADLRSNAERELNNVLYLTRGLSSYFSVRHDSLERDEILSILRVAYQTSPLIRNFGVAVNYRLTYVYPPEGNQAAIGLDYRELESQWPDVKRAVEQRRPVLSEGVDLLQGGKAFVYRDPIYVDDAYWGLLSTVIDAEPLLDAMFGVMEGDSRHRFSVRANRRNQQPVHLWGDDALFHQDGVVRLTSGRDWEFVVQTRTGDTHWLPIFTLRIFGWVLALVAALGTYSAVLHRRQRLVPGSRDRKSALE
ncbi:CHASE domain-containing protein [Marinimicrobium sp. C6131]|uniref:CHASE domain-containing protein n=1 Tax=Marinimicrobium sp. C6131 TaxID=3022676 RepID=UPI00223D70B1|nr:CHASE domain-containing protein [Marinimicrobium sp. C6131]UZJ45822.1 CHASE domain-containing protein [Marinimicrobium sp. C6131]